MGDEVYELFPDVSGWTAVPFDPTTYDQYAALLEQARAEATDEAREHAVRTAIRYAGTDTGAIEGLYTTDRGFTRTVAIEAAHWEAAANERGPNAAMIIKDQIHAYEWVLDLVTRKVPVTEHVIRELHAILCRNQDTYVVHTDAGEQRQPLPKGEYKRFPNNPTSALTGRLHHYAPPDTVPAEMARLVTSLSSPEYTTAHPVIQAAYLHYSLVAIHPFADGNGRTTRALASVPLYRDVRVPLIVFRDQRDDYLDSLAAADAGERGPFVSFVEERVLDAVDLARNSVRVGAIRDRDRSISTIQAAHRISGLDPDEIEALASRVKDEVAKALETHLRDPGWPSRVSGVLVQTRRVARISKLPEGYRWPGRDLSVSVNVRSPAPAEAWADVTVTVAVAVRNGVPPLLVTTQRPDVPDLDLVARDVTPQLREVARIKIVDWSALVIDASLRDLARAIEAGGAAS
ncbi:MAG TPA: Fic family protein [Frankiaceae bacterium]|nr:Fic family protein [Frankiaceae bacterium]